MKNKNLTATDIQKYLQENHSLSAEELFELKHINPESHFKIFDRMFKELINHWVDEQGYLVTEDPSEPLMRFYVYNFPGFQIFNNMEDLLKDMNGIVGLRSQKVQQYKRMMEHGKSNTENEYTITKKEDSK